MKSIATIRDKDIKSSMKFIKNRKKLSLNLMFDSQVIITLQRSSDLVLCCSMLYLGCPRETGDGTEKRGRLLGRNLLPPFIRGSNGVTTKHNVECY